MTLCEALDWCRKEKALLHMRMENVTVASQYGMFDGKTIEEAVSACVESKSWWTCPDCGEKAKLMPDGKHAYHDCP